jgi:hypothetical protein
MSQWPRAAQDNGNDGVCGVAMSGTCERSAPAQQKTSRASVLRRLQKAGCTMGRAHTTGVALAPHAQHTLPS